MIVVKEQGRLWLDLDALAMFLGRKRRTIRKHCQPENHNGRRLYDAKTCADRMKYIPERG